MLGQRISRAVFSFLVPQTEVSMRTNSNIRCWFRQIRYDYTSACKVLFNYHLCDIIVLNHFVYVVKPDGHLKLPLATFLVKGFNGDANSF